MPKYLFIGGPCDGERHEVVRAREGGLPPEYVRVAPHGEPSKLAPVNHDLAPAAFQTYGYGAEMLCDAGGVQRWVYLSITHDRLNLLAHLISGYRGAAK